ncbi:NirD/YgiW/YdeI family stress tolerance protein [Sphingosinicella rhizophila]|uniref:NirD/YgiW/YdeI family stress tolerance protein n=1 Tax=Sphingosinicella rhizophila TaxID=3050082 RepID=A0ABU3Q9Q6_9SPHN|nr:NirD/YgiW/YdeI family stress tolerance protein [Sphingosinicella sp. GR2756]MDT9600141.1 NirD/YgiW/YdeI family stress tolerance protein [Sphingosinicella sp. GR2756]
MMVRIPSTSLALVAAPLMLVAACDDNDRNGEAVTGDELAVGTLDPETRLAAATDQSWINLNGTVVSTTTDSFVLDYGSDTVTVEMDDWDWYREGQALAPGDPVVVTGKVDSDLWRAKRIEASSVYAKNLNTYFYASGADEEDLLPSTVYVPPSPSSSDTTGYVTAVEGQEFTIGSGMTATRVDTSKITASKRPAVKVGDRVYVWGNLDLDPREKSEIMAEGIVILAKDKTKISDGASESENITAGADGDQDQERTNSTSTRL